MWSLVLVTLTNPRINSGDSCSVGGVRVTRDTASARESAQLWIQRLGRLAEEAKRRLPWRPYLFLAPEA